MASSEPNSGMNSLFPGDQNQQIQHLFDKIRASLEASGDLIVTDESASATTSESTPVRGIKPPPQALGPCKVADDSRGNDIKCSPVTKPREEEPVKSAASALMAPSDRFTSYRSSAVKNHDNDEGDSSDDEANRRGREVEMPKSTVLSLFPDYVPPSRGEVKTNPFTFGSPSSAISKGSTKRKYTWNTSNYSSTYNFTSGPVYNKEWTEEEKKSLIAFAEKWIPTRSPKRQKTSSDSTPSETDSKPSS